MQDRSSSSPQLPTRQFVEQPQQPLLRTNASLPEPSLLSQQKEIVSSPDQNDNSSRSDSIYQTSSGSISVTQYQNSSSQSTVSLPKYQSPTVTLLQKARGKIDNHNVTWTSTNNVPNFHEMWTSWFRPSTCLQTEKDHSEMNTCTFLMRVLKFLREKLWIEVYWMSDSINIWICSS